MELINSVLSFYDVWKTIIYSLYGLDFVIGGFSKNVTVGRHDGNENK